MTERERNKHVRKVERIRKAMMPKVTRLMRQALAKQTAAMMELVKRGEFNGVYTAEVPVEPMYDAFKVLYPYVGIPFARRAQEQIIKASFDTDWWLNFFAEYVAGDVIQKELLRLTKYTKEQVIGIVDSIAMQPVDGLSISEMSAMIADKVETAQGYRARRIARTEMLTASSTAQQQSIKEMDGAGQVLKFWVAATDMRTREDHILMNTKEGIPLDGMYEVGGYTAAFPGDPSLPADQRINCRCTEVYEMRED